jgi:phosphotransferase system  glucose/maltose/N-acetylglucosamine-specific IIC component
MMRKTGQVLISVIITPIGAMVALVLVSFFLLGIVQAILGETLSFGLRLARGKTAKNKTLQNESPDYLAEAKRAA